MKIAAVLALSACLSVADDPSFEAASVKASNSPSNGMNGYIGIRRGGSLTMGNITLHTMIGIAYALPDYRISGGPGWLNADRYNVDAKPASQVSQDVARQMFQNLLAERFHLRVHHETKNVDGYILAAPKGDSKMEKLGADDPVGFRYQQPGRIEGPATVDMLSRILAGILGVPVENQTALGGKYSMAIEWNPNDAADDNRPSIFAALSERLGLVLKREKVAIDVLVIDHAEKPAPN